jgi:hypothetical protein
MRGSVGVRVVDAFFAAGLVRIDAGLVRIDAGLVRIDIVRMVTSLLGFSKSESDAAQGTPAWCGDQRVNAANLVLASGSCAWPLGTFSRDAIGIACVFCQFMPNTHAIRTANLRT